MHQDPIDLQIKVKRLEQRIWELEQRNANLEEQLARQAYELDQFKTLVATAPDGIVITDRGSSTIIYMNHAGRRLTGYSDLPGNVSIIDLLSGDAPDQQVSGERPFQQVLAGTTWTGAVLCHRADGSYFRSQVTGFRIGSGEQQSCTTAWLIRDITDRIQLEETLWQSRAILQGIFDYLPASIYVTNTQGQFVLVNTYLANTVHLSADQMIGKTINELFLRVDPDPWVAIDRDILAMGKPVEIEHPGVFDDQCQTYLTTRFPIYDTQGMIIAVGGFSIDITRRKHAEEALRESEIRYRVISDLISDYAYAFDVMPDGSLTFLWVTDSFRYITEESEAQAGWMHLIHPEDRAITQQHTMRLLHNHADVSEYRIITRTGETRWLRDYSKPVWDEAQGRVVRIYGAAQDITERKHAAEVQANEIRFRTVADFAYDWEYWLDLTGTLLYVSPSCERITGYNPAEFHANPELLKSIIHPDDQDRFADHLHDELIGESAMQIEFRIISRDGNECWIGHVCQCVYDDAQRWLGRRVSNRDITATKQIEQALQESERFNRQLIETTPAVVYVHHVQEQRNVYANRELTKILGYTAEDPLVMGQTVEALLHPDDRELKMVINPHRLQTAQDGEIIESEFRMRSAAGDWHWFHSREMVFKRDADGTVTHIVGTALEITERVRMEEALRNSESIYRGMFEKNRAIKLLVDPENGAILGANEAASRFYGYSRETLMTMSISDINTLSPDQVQHEMQQARSAERLYFRFRHRLASGDLRDVEVYSGPLETQGRTILYSIVHDITDRQRAEEELRKLQRAVEHSPTSVRITNFAGDIEYINPAFSRTTGYTLAEVRGRNSRFLQSGHTPPETYADLWATIKAGETWRGEFRNRKKNGELFWEQASISPIFDASGTITHFVEVSEDISERKLLQRELLLREQRLNAFFTTAPAGLILLDARICCININEAAAMIHGIAVPVPGDVPLSKTTSQLAYTLIPMYQHVLQTGLPIQGIEISGEVPGQPGVVRFWQTSIFPVASDDGTSDNVGAVFVEMTERKWTEAALRESEELYRLLSENSRDLICLHEPQGNYLYLSPAITDLLGYHQWELIGFNPLALLPPDDTQCLQKLELALAGTLEDSVEYRILHKNGTYIWFETIARPIYDESGSIVKIQTSSRDVTDRRLFEEALRERTYQLSIANSELARAVRAKDEFLANMSHELRTPLHAILGLTELLQEQVYGHLTERQQSALQHIMESGQHLLTLINDILDLAKIEAGHAEIDIHPIEIEPVCQASIRLIKQLARNKHIGISEQYDAPATVHADARRLKQILVNLLSNAVKFTPEHGRIGLEVRGDPTNQIVHFTVWDTGIGIAPDQQEHLFKPFVQIDSRLSRQYEGTGLGLALVWKLVELHGGGITVESEEQKGSRFTISFPWRDDAVPAVNQGEVIVSPRMQDTPYIAYNLDGPLILLAEDNKISMTMLTDYLTSQGYRIVVAQNGEEAISIAQIERPDVILMDIQMPKLDGLEATRRIRSQESLKGIPIIALTALAMPGDRERCLAAGVHAYLSKPISLGQLKQVIEEVL